MPKLTPLPANYNQLLAEVKERIRSAQYAALKAVNTELVGLYWDLGRMIVERQSARPGASPLWRNSPLTCNASSPR
jgi:hypothetical protein